MKKLFRSLTPQPQKQKQDCEELQENEHFDLVETQSKFHQFVLSKQLAQQTQQKNETLESQQNYPNLEESGSFMFSESDPVNEKQDHSMQINSTMMIHKDGASSLHSSIWHPNDDEEFQNKNITNLRINKDKNRKISNIGKTDNLDLQPQKSGRNSLIRSNFVEIPQHFNQDGEVYRDILR
eukprot:403347225